MYFAYIYFNYINQSINLLILKEKTITKVKWLLGPRSFACNGPQRTRIKHYYKIKKKKTKKNTGTRQGH